MVLQGNLARLYGLNHILTQAIEEAIPELVGQCGLFDIVGLTRPGQRGCAPQEALASGT